MMLQAATVAALEAGVWTPQDAETLVTCGLAGYVTRVGLGDTLYLPDGSRARNNADLVTAARHLGAGTVA